MAITHTFLDAIPAIFLGAPDADTALGVLPGHQLLLEGKGYEAVQLTVVGSLASLLIAVMLFPLLLFFIPKLYLQIESFIGTFLIIIVAYLIVIETTFEKKIWSLFVFLLSGMLGVLALTSLNVKQPFFPLLSGLFGISMLLVSLSQNTTIPKQQVTNSNLVSKKDSTKAIAAGTISGSFVSFFPGLGPAQAAVIGSQLFGKLSQCSWLILIGSINTVNMIVSLVSLYTLNKTRNGAVLAIKELFATIDILLLLLFLVTALVVSGLATFLALSLAKIAASLIEKINYRKLCYTVIGLIVLLTIYFSSWIGLLILITATAIGIIPNVVAVKRSHAMGCLLLPVMLFFLL